ncbi:MAG TPA: hypothetical protein VJ806_14595 [Luteimonas sp.]|nr:hypothetical protein [Luteimonas sp.]
MGQSRNHALLLTTCLLASCQTQAKQPNPAFPPQVRGTWEPGPAPCRLPLDYDSDAGFEIRPEILIGYEHTQKPTKVQQISVNPNAWRVESIEEYDGNKTRKIEIYVLHDDSMTVANQSMSQQYNRCHNNTNNKQAHDG